MKNFSLAIILLVALTACSTEYQYYLETDDANGVEEGAKIYRQGVEIGEVTEVEFVDRKVRLSIETDSPLFEDQDFDLGRGPEGEPAVELDGPDRNAGELASGETLEDGASFDFDLDDGMSEVFKDAFGADGEKLEEKMKDIFGEDGEKMEVRIKELFGEDGEKLEEAVENILGKDGEKLEAAIENVLGKDGENIKTSIESLIGKDGEKLQESIEAIIGKDGEKLERWAEEFGDEFEELGERIEAVDKLYEKDSPEWKREMKKVMQEWADSRN
ncbi:hypothetical protein CEQ90_15285 [Lewinellaceae bacterium SD302]|nr:hypothetical protein CEQ90_15285 [Lewinellaceae bacterium SD302]